MTLSLSSSDRHHHRKCHGHDDHRCFHPCCAIVITITTAITIPIAMTIVVIVTITILLLNNAIVNNITTIIITLTNKFHVAVRLFSNTSQMTSKCGKNKNVAPSVSMMFLPQFDVFCDLLLNRRRATWNLFLLHNKLANKSF